MAVVSAAPSVLIVGAGPTGLVAACTLLRHGVDCRVVDVRGGPAREPKALILWAGALEALRRTGVSDEIEEAALPLERASYWSRGRRLGMVRFAGLAGTAFPQPLCAPQPVTEHALYRRLLDLGGTVEWGVEATSCVATSEHATVVLEHGTTRNGERGRREEVTVPWLIAADGARSAVRGVLGIPFEGGAYDRDFLLGDVTLDGPAPVGEAQYHFTPQGVLVVVPLPGGGHRIFFDEEPGAGTGVPDRDLLQRLLDERGPGRLTIGTIAWQSRFHVQTRMAGRFRHGRAFLAGDAAHCHSPAGGQGLNTGVQDGFDLGWKLAAVLRGADDALLDGYEAERRPASATAVRNAERQTRLWLVRSSILRAGRDVLLRGLSRSGALERKLVPQLAQLHLDLSASPAIASAGVPAGVPGTVRPGRRMPDAALSPVRGTAAATLHDYLAQGRHTLVIAGDRGDGDAERLAAECREAILTAGADDLADVLLILRSAGTAPPPDVPYEPPGVPYDVVRDVGGALTSAAAPWAAYVRPDGVVGSCLDARTALESGASPLPFPFDRVSAPR
ncbi:FAD-dependent monooxygenase [Actinomadura sp. 1N219]|uniref:FAD-dependent monooxygenase n=1 Tax=Actinomadura sp. 1N219 TaxID=3375152 RepID=UPI0037875E42